MSVTHPVPEDLARELAPDYEIVGELGRGGVSVVYLARECELGREVAIKVIRDLYTRDGEAVARFEREARMLARLQHPHIVTLYTARRLPGGALALVMQYGPWQTLKAVIHERGPMPADAAESVLRDIAGALMYLHRHDVIHRDIKPENMFLDRETGRALLSDFGLAKPGGNANENVTLAGVVIGTPAYMSPEQIDGGALDGQSDVYSLGMVGYEMLTGRRPWEGESLYNVIYKQKHEQLPPLREVRPELPESLCRAIEAATEKDRARRLPSVEAFLSELPGAAPAAIVGRAAAIPPRVTAPAPRAPDEVPTIELELIAAEFRADAPRWRGGTIRRRAMIAAPLVLVLVAGVGAAAVALNTRPAELGTPSPLESSVLPPAAPPAAAQGPSGPVSGAEASPLPETHSLALAAAAVLDSTAAASPSPADPAPRAEAPPESRAAPRPEGTPPAAAAAPPRAQPRRAAREPVTAAPVTPAPVANDSQLAALGRASIPVRTALPRSSDESQSAASPLLNRVTVDARVEAPQLRSPASVQQSLLNVYPPRLRRRGIGGLVVVSVLVGPTGEVLDQKIASSSGDSQLDAAALKAAGRMDFMPGKKQGIPTALWAEIPLVFQVDRRD